VLEKSQCRDLAEARLAVISVESGEPCVLLQEEVERKAVMAYFYQSAAYVESGNPLDALAGNAPLLVNRVSGEVVMAGTALPVEHYIHQLEEKIGVAASNNFLRLPP